MGQLPDLDGSTAVVVGASGGWGRGVAIALAQEGVRVVVNGRNADAVAGVVEEIERYGGHALGCAVPVHTPEGAEELVDFSITHLGQIDILVNSSGGKVSRSILDVSPSEFDMTVDAQLKAPFLVTHLVARSMVDAKVRGKIINMAGGSSVRPFDNESLHGATKAGILAATWVWALELAPHGITVNAVRGGVRSPGTVPLIQAIRRQLGDAGTLNEVSDRDLGFFEPEEAAPLVVWLASERAAGITGQFVGIDGPKITIWGLPDIAAELVDERGWDAPRLDAEVRPVLEAATAKDRGEAPLIDTMKHLKPA